MKPSATGSKVHGFFVIGSPGETEKDIMASFRFAARLKLDTFGFNRLCAYRGTPLWQEYVDRGIIDDERIGTNGSSAPISIPPSCPAPQ